MNGPLLDFNGRVRDRVREQRRRRVWLWVRVVAVLVLVGGLVWALTSSPLLSVKKVDVVGNSAVPLDTITKAAQVPMGAPLARVDTPGIARRLGAVPGIARADVSISLPDAVTIKVTERPAVFVVAVSGGFALIDPSGRRFAESASKPADIPLAAANVDDQTLLADVAAVVGALPSGVASALTQIDAQTRDSISLQLGDKVRINWGSADASVLKGQVADTLVKSQAGCRLIDVSSPTHPTTRC